MIKLTQGTDYENPYAAAQFRAWANVMHNHGQVDPKVGFYDYATGYSGTNNAKFFLAWLKAFEVDKDTAIALDFEDPSVAGNGEVNEWLAEIKKAGYKNNSVYSMGSWFGSRLNTVAIQTNNYWIASYSDSAPTLARSRFYKTAWQFSDNWKGLGADMSLDYGHILAPNNKKTPKVKKAAKPKNTIKKHTNKPVHKPVSKPKVNTKPQYANQTGIYRLNTNLNLFLDNKLTKKVGVLPKGTIIHAQAVSDNGCNRLQTTAGLYLTGRIANPAWVHLIKAL